MKIAVFDIDGTITEEVEFMRKHAIRFPKKGYELDAREVNPNGYKLSEIYNVEELLEEKGYTSKEAKIKAEQVAQEFWNKYFLKYCNESLREGVRETIDALRKSGYAVHIVTMRAKTGEEEKTVKDIAVRKIIIPFLTRRQLRKEHIKPDYLIMPATIEEKVEYIRAVNPQLVFEDQAVIIEKVAECINSKSKIVCVNNCYNAGRVFADNVIRINNFQEEVHEKILQNMIGCSTVKDTSKKTINIFYRVMKIIGTPIVYLVYRPIICGQHLIPKDKNVAFVGNHRKKSDPIIMIAAIKQTVHWAALQRMFEGKEDLFSESKRKWKCNLSARLLKWMGAVPIARQDSPDCAKINLETIRFLTNQLKEKKASVGFFSEGTLNRNFKSQNILPLKSNRIFRFVAVADAYIQPFSIVWIPANKLIKNRVMVVFSYPINVEKRSADELSAMWKNAVGKSIQECNVFIEDLIKIEAQKGAMLKKRKQSVTRFCGIRDFEALSCRQKKIFSLFDCQCRTRHC